MAIKKRFLWVALAITASTAVPPQSVHSALPPKSNQQLRQSSTHIVIGKITSIQTQEVAQQYGTDYEHTARIQIENLEKPRSTPLKSRQTINVYYTTIKDRKAMSPAGSQRQSQPLEKGTRVKLFLVERAPGKFFLLEPNGWQRIQKKTTSR